MKKSESIAAIAKALSTFQGEVKQPMKDKDNPFFKSKYVPLENVVEAITEISAKHGLSFLQYPSNFDDKVGITTILMHSSGEWIETDTIYAKPAKSDAQATGSVITYLKRYSLAAAFGITSDEDDDGNAASGSKKNEAQVEMITASQMKALGAKSKAAAEKQGSDQATVYKTAAGQFGINKQAKDLTKAEASKIIDQLAKLEG